MVLSLLVLLTHPASAAVTRVEVTERSEVPGVRCERIIGKVYFAVDPRLPANRIITDIDLAPRNAQGLVEFSADLYVLKPAQGSGAALLEISNRGRRDMLNMFSLASAGREFGDQFLVEQGYTLVWIGWQFDVPRRPGLLRLYTPVARGVTGLVRSDFVLDARATTASLADRNHIPYLVANPDDPTVQLTVRDRPDGPRSVVPRSRWRFTEDGGVQMDSGFEPARIYEVVYTSQDPAIVGLGPAAVRDYVAHLKETGAVKRAIGFGTSQSGRFLRTFLYYGFNADEQGRAVFDGVWAHVAGAGRGSFNHRFAQPSRDAHPLLNFFYPTDIFPFTDEPETDAGITGGLLVRAAKDGVVPKIFYTNGSYEYWGRAASLIHSSPDGLRDVPPARDTRIYFLAGTQHGPNSPASRLSTRNLTNPADYRYAMRALLVAMNRWLTDGTPPPASRYPGIAKDQLVSLGALRFPKIPGVTLPTRTHMAWRVDYGPEFLAKGIVSREPPKLGPPFAILLPQVNAEGNETSGIRMPELEVPLATYTGWNLRDPRLGAPDTMANLVGSMIPFARTKAEREAAGDPRPSIEERYRSREHYLARIRQVAADRVRDGFLLERDVDAVVAAAAARWDQLAAAAR